MLISVVVPCYNAAPWIEAALESVAAQASAELELIVVDDGSTDDTAALVERACPWARLLRVTNGGPSRARNLGWRTAQGAWVQFLDADDLLHPAKLATQARQAYALPASVAVLYSDWQRHWVIGRQATPDGPPLRPHVDVDPQTSLLRTEGFIQLGAALFRRTWLEQVGGFDEAHWLIEDVELMLRIAMAGGQFRHVPADVPLFTYRQREGSLSRRDTRAFIEGCVRNARMMERHWCGERSLTAERARLLADIYCFGARFFADADQAEFTRLADAIDNLVPNYLPLGPPLLRGLARLIGYRRAEPLVVRLRQLRHAGSIQT